MNPFDKAASLLITIDEEQRKGFGIECNFKRPVVMDQGFDREGDLRTRLLRPVAGHERERRDIRPAVVRQSAGDSLLTIPGALELNFDRFVRGYADCPFLTPGTGDQSQLPFSLTRSDASHAVGIGRQPGAGAACSRLLLAGAVDPVDLPQRR